MQNGRFLERHDEWNEIDRRSHPPPAQHIKGDRSRGMREVYRLLEKQHPVRAALSVRQPFELRGINAGERGYRRHWHSRDYTRHLAFSQDQRTGCKGRLQRYG